MATNKTHPLKELEVLLGCGVYHLDSMEDGGTDEACQCLREAAELVSVYIAELGFDAVGNPPGELLAAEARIKARRG